MIRRLLARLRCAFGGHDWQRVSPEEKRMALSARLYWPAWCKRCGFSVANEAWAR